MKRKTTPPSSASTPAVASATASTSGPSVSFVLPAGSEREPIVSIPLSVYAATPVTESLLDELKEALRDNSYVDFEELLLRSALLKGQLPAAKENDRFYHSLFKCLFYGVSVDLSYRIALVLRVIAERFPPLVCPLSWHPYPTKQFPAQQQEFWEQFNTCLLLLVEKELPELHQSDVLAFVGDACHFDGSAETRLLGYRLWLRHVIEIFEFDRLHVVNPSGTILCRLFQRGSRQAQMQIMKLTMKLVGKVSDDEADSSDDESDDTDAANDAPDDGEFLMDFERLEEDESESDTKEKASKSKSKSTSNKRTQSKKKTPGTKQGGGDNAGLKDDIDVSFRLPVPQSAPVTASDLGAVDNHNRELLSLFQKLLQQVVWLLTEAKPSDVNGLLSEDETNRTLTDHIKSLHEVHQKLLFLRTMASLEQRLHLLEYLLQHEYDHAKGRKKGGQIQKNAKMTAEKLHSYLQLGVAKKRNPKRFYQDFAVYFTALLEACVLLYPDLFTPGNLAPLKPSMLLLCHLMGDIEDQPVLSRCADRLCFYLGSDASALRDSQSHDLVVMLSSHADDGEEVAPQAETK